MIKTARRATVALALLLLVACGSGDDEDSAPATEPAPAATATSPSTAAAASSSPGRTGCGVTLADVQALLPAGSGVTQNSTPDAFRCNFTWNEGGPRGIDVARVVGGRAAFEQQGGAKVPAGATALKDGTPYENVAGLGDRAWAYGNARQANVVVLRGADLIAASLVVDGTPPAGTKTPTGMDAKSLEICQALARKALA